ncbi:PA2779 family protein [Pistricoccus aurantiacus]|uniref:PA2779 family protein n=1 Tax=Pistricoccus aurantiacus TaxID=1883414 RepID=UPI00363FFC6A
MKKIARFLSPILIAFLILGSLPVAAAQATAASELISTQQALQADQANADRERILDVLARDDVQRQLELQGVDPQEVKDRVAALSDAEARQMADQLDQLPAGASSVVGALLVIFLVLLVTDILGLTNVYPFTR